MFAPYYYDESAPLGEWQVTGHQVFPPGWFPYGNINQDFAFLTMRGDVCRPGLAVLLATLGGNLARHDG
jgi:hypothetical protein